MARGDVYYVYCIGTACGDSRRDFLFTGPLTEDETANLYFGKDPNWYAVSYIMYEPCDVPGGYSRHPDNTKEFYEKAKALCQAPFYNTVHGDDSLRELEAWYTETLSAPPADKVQPFWWENPAGGSYVNTNAAWAATVAIAKGA